MLSVLNDAARLCDGVSRREWLRIGGLSWLGMSLPGLRRSRPAVASAPTTRSFGRARSCILLFLSGGPPQHETFDPKPDAPAELRSPFKPIPTNVPGVRFCELLPRTASMADRLTIIRSMTTEIHSHSSSGYYMLTGFPHPAGQLEVPAATMFHMLGIDPAGDFNDRLGRTHFLAHAGTPISELVNA
jgi:hypothetical protein